jgi:F-type H+-transporting ATPase subunit a
LDKGTEFILEELTDSVIIPLPKVFGVDLSITKAVVVMWIASAILIALFAFAFRRRSLVPHGLANFLEMVIVFLYKDVFTPYLGEHARRFAPFLLTLFFFILVNNLLGLVPPNFKATANISVTSGLSVITFIVVIGSGIKGHGLKGMPPTFFPKEYHGLCLSYWPR